MSHRQRGPSKSFEDPTTPPDTGDRGSQNDPPPPRAGNLPNSTQKQPRMHSPNSQSSTITPSPPPHPNPPPPGVLWKNVGNTIPVGFTEVPAPALAELITTKLELTALELQNLQAPRLTYNHCVKANGSYFVPTPPGWCRPFGLSWKNLGSVRPVRGSEVSSPTLASILADRLEITLDEFHSLDLHHLSFGHYVKSGDNYYGPRLHRLKSGARLRGYLADWLADQKQLRYHRRAPTLYQSYPEIGGGHPRFQRLPIHSRPAKGTKGYLGPTRKMDQTSPTSANPSSRGLKQHQQRGEHASELLKAHLQPYQSRHYV